MITIEQAVVLLGSAILLAAAMLILVGTAIAINRLLHKFWVPVNIFTPETYMAFKEPTKHD